MDEGSMFCSRCGNKVVSDNVTEENGQKVSLEQETPNRDYHVDVLKPVIIIAIICIAGYFIGNGLFKAPEGNQQNSYVETSESDTETVAEAYGIMTDDYNDTYEDDTEHDYDLLSALYKACVTASYDPEISDVPLCDSVVTREYLEDSDWGWNVLSIMGVYSLSEIEGKLKSNESNGNIEIYRDSSGDYIISSGRVVVY
jgi:hypothetical protein